MTIVVRLFGFLAELQSALCSYGRPGVAEATQNWRTGARNQALSLSFGTWTEQPSAFCWIRDSAMDLVPRKLSLQPPECSDSAGQRNLDGVHRVLQDGLSFPAGLYLHPQDTKQEARLQGNRIN